MTLLLKRCVASLFGIAACIEGNRSSTLQESVTALLEDAECWGDHAALTDDVSILALELAPDDRLGRPASPRN